MSVSEIRISGVYNIPFFLSANEIYVSKSHLRLRGVAQSNSLIYFIEHPLVKLIAEA